jgi:YggT family protein
MSVNVKTERLMVGIIIAVVTIVQYALQFFIYVLIANAIFSWLYAFNVINTRSPVVDSIARVLYQLTEPVLRPIRRFLPNLGGVDLSPIVAVLIVIFLQMIIANPIAPALIGLFGGV